MKNKATNDKQGWNNKILKNAGTDVTNSLQIIINKIN